MIIPQRIGERLLSVGYDPHHSLCQLFQRSQLSSAVVRVGRWHLFLIISQATARNLQRWWLASRTCQAVLRNR